MVVITSAVILLALGHVGKWALWAFSLYLLFAVISLLALGHVGKWTLWAFSLY